jgi:hypothetical protein
VSAVTAAVSEADRESVTGVRPPEYEPTTQVNVSMRVEVALRLDRISDFAVYALKSPGSEKVLE